MDRDTRAVLSMGERTVPTDKTQTDMSSNVIKKSGSNECEEISISEISQIVVDVKENQQTNNGQEIPEHTANDLRYTTLNGGGTSNGSTPSNTSEVNENSISFQAAPSSLQDQPETLRQISIPFSTSERDLHLPPPGPASSSVNASLSSSNAAVSSTRSHVNDIPSSVPTSYSMGQSQVADQVPPSQLLDTRVTDVSYAGTLSYLRDIPPPQYTAEPPIYDAIGRTRSPATVSEIQRSAPFPLEMPPSYDETVQADRAYIVRDIRRQGPVVSRSQPAEIKCCVSCCCWVSVVILILFVIGMIIARDEQ